MAEEDQIAPALQPERTEEQKVERTRKRTLGNVRLRHKETNEIILIPTPSKDPNDPLNWPQWYKHMIAVIICLAMMWCNFLAAGPTIAIVRTTLSFYPDSPPTVDPAGFSKNIAKVAYFFTTTALLQGTGNFFWVPIANKFGRRPVYLMSYTLYLACAIWLIFDKTYSGFLAGRIIMGFAAGAAETIAPTTIADVFFLHERGTIMALYTSFLSVGVAFGIIIAGLITINHDWRVIYEVAAAIVGFVLLVAFFAFPETAYIRDVPYTSPGQTQRAPSEKSGAAVSDIEQASTPIPPRKTYLQTLKVYNGKLTNESFLKMVVRPLGLICLPPVLWAALVQSVTIGFLVAVTSNVDAAFEATYNFEPWQVGLCFISAVIGSILGIPAGGHMGDIVADWFTKRNGGIREPEMRLPAMIPCLITTPLALILYGVGIQHKLHWMCPTVGLGLLNFSIAQGTNVCLVYVIDAYRPVSGEITLAVMGFKSLFGFLLSFYTNPWVAESGYQNAYGAMAGIAAAVIIMWVPLYIWGTKIRHVTWHWPIISYIHWSDDREVGE
ncbi:putative mfs transporter protein [Phaeoacremonium minimum UCRPA7]|uniref:Putative mfs transporter protein n=1 Tax=Phaeoacremonium minimum (strain UCR-PA7) TaxID=1286976 RepID=R8BF76_PHAM7|nr:putative mfs transporter protein [Phaeoacremonium minimum UCRPA7]EON97942.1 putative mfs transporter protein [Phaeoacremonium minimum UCRPA7]